jgi:hypothetical protein
VPRVSTPHPTTTVSNRTRRQIPSTITSTAQHEQPIPSVPQPRQYRLVYISDDDDQPRTTTQPSPAIVNTTFSLVTDDEDEEPRRPQVPSRRTVRSTNSTGHNTR